MIRVQDVEWPRSKALSVSEVDALYIHPLTSQFIEALSPERARGIELDIHYSTIPSHGKSKPLFTTYEGSRQLDSGVALTYFRIPVDRKAPALGQERGNKKRLRVTGKSKVVGSTKDRRRHQAVRGL